MKQLAAFLILIVTILGVSSGKKGRDGNLAGKKGRVGNLAVKKGRVGNLAVKYSTPVALYWSQGKVPYEISQEFDHNESNVIKDALTEIMISTCIEFVPRTSESDYVAFMKYKNPDQQRGSLTCWSGKWNNGNGTVGFQKGTHIVSLWPHLECWNKFGIVREVLKVLGFQTIPLSKVTYKRKDIIIRSNYEENFRLIKKDSVFRTSCEKDLLFLKRFPFAVDKKEWMLTTRNSSCSLARGVIQINRSYNCSAEYDGLDSTPANDSKLITTAMCEGIVNGNFDGKYTITCPSSPTQQKITVVKARYGRYSKDICIGLNDHLKCHKDVLKIIRKLCNGKKKCNVEVNNERMGGEPCFAIYKYLEVQYYCA